MNYKLGRWIFVCRGDKYFGINKLLLDSRNRFIAVFTLERAFNQFGADNGRSGNCGLETDQLSHILRSQGANSKRLHC
jgi:hypothetical protein